MSDWKHLALTVASVLAGLLLLALIAACGLAAWQAFTGPGGFVGRLLEGAFFLGLGIGLSVIAAQFAEVTRRG